MRMIGLEISREIMLKAMRPPTVMLPAITASTPRNKIPADVSFDKEFRGDRRFHAE